jgi:phage gpG-like protein
MAKVVEVKIEDNSEEVLEAMNEQVLAWLEAIGEDAAGTAADKAPVDTGRLKSSISSAVVESEKAAYIGTNVEYAPYQEFGTSRGIKGKHFLQFGATAHQAEYKALLEQYLKE